MMQRFASLAACLALAAPSLLYAQTADEADGEVDLNAIDALLGGQEVTGDAEMDADVVEEETDDATGASEDEDEAPEDIEDGGDAEAMDEEEAAPEPSDLTIAFNAYSLCSSEAGAALEETGFALDVIGEEALLRCSGQRAAYVNAFYFSLLPRDPDAQEAAVRASAERLVAQTDMALAALVTDEVTALRAEREAAPETDTGEDAEPSEDDAPSEDNAPDNPDGETAEDEMEDDA